MKRIRRTALLLALVAPPVRADLSAPVRVNDLGPPWPVGAIRAMAYAEGVLYGMTGGISAPAELECLASPDLGRTWELRGSLGGGSAVSLAAAATGRLDVLRRGGSPSFLLIHNRSLDGGTTWSADHALPPVGGSYEPILSVSETGTLLVLAPEPSAQFVVLRSADGGDTWTVGDRIPASSQSAAAVAWTGPASALVCWSQRSPWALLCRASNDDGQTFAAPVTVVDPLPGSTEVALVARAAGDAVLALATWDTLRVTRSTDGGANWLPPSSLFGPVERVSDLLLAADADGGVWLGASRYDSPISVPIFHSPDATSWTPHPWPLEHGGCFWELSNDYDQYNRPPQTQILVGAEADTAVLATGPFDGLSWRSSDRGVTWDDPTTIAPAVPVHDTVVVRTTGGRLVAIWVEGLRPAAIFARYSDDGGASWVGPVVVSDAAPSIRRHPGTPFSTAEERSRLPYHSIDAVATADGGLAIAWLAHGATCAEVRVTRSTDGSDFGPSAPAGSFEAHPLSIAEDAADRLAVSWLEGGNLVVAVSDDGGTSWSPPAVAVTERTPTKLWPSHMVSAADGSLVMLALHRNGTAGPSDLEAYRSTDGGASWTPSSIATVPDWSSLPMLLATPAGLLASVSTSPRSNDVTHLNWESLDSGATFTPSARQASPSAIAAADPSSNVFFARGQFAAGSGRVRISRSPASGPDVDLGAITAGNSYQTPGLVGLPGDHVGVFFPAWTPPLSPPGVFYAIDPCTPPAFAPLTDVAVCVGAPVTLHIEMAPGQGDTLFQWHRGAGPTDIPGATEVDYEIAAASPADADIYGCVVRNACASLDTGNVRVSLLYPPATALQSLTIARTASVPTAYWSNQADATSYRLLSDVARDGGFSQVVGEGANGNDGLAVPVSSDEIVYYTLVPVNACGDGPR